MRARRAGWLHAVGHLLCLGRAGGRGPRRSGARGGRPAVRLRRLSQRRDLLGRLLDPAPEGWPAPAGEPLFWRALRWGGPALLLGAWLGRSG